jgi:hypothetical protein
MGGTVSDLFKTTSTKVKGSYWVIWLFVAVVVVLVSGCYYFFEDAYSSYIGIQQIQETMSVKIVTFPVGLVLLAVTPQFAQVVLGFLAATQPDRNKLKYYVGVLCFWLIDGAFDVWYRSDQRLLDDPRSAVASILVTFLVYTLFSEMFIMIGGGLFLELFPSFKSQMGKFVADVRKPGRRTGTAQTTANNRRTSRRGNNRRTSGRVHAQDTYSGSQSTTRRDVEDLANRL